MTCPLRLPNSPALSTSRRWRGGAVSHALQPAGDECAAQRRDASARPSERQRAATGEGRTRIIWLQIDLVRDLVAVAVQRGAAHADRHLATGETLDEVERDVVGLICGPASESQFVYSPGASTRSPSVRQPQPNIRVLKWWVKGPTLVASSGKTPLVPSSPEELQTLVFAP